MFPLTIRSANNYPSSSVQIPWANTPRNEILRTDHIEQAVSGKTYDTIADTDDYRIRLPYTDYALNRMQIGLPSILDTGTHDLYELFQKGVFPYIVEYTHPMQRGVLAYTKALILIQDGKPKIYTGTATTRTESQFFGDLPADSDSQTQAPFNRSVLNTILSDVAKRKIHPVHEIQETAKASHLSELIKHPEYVSTALKNPHLTAANLLEIVQIHTNHTSFRDILRAVLNHPSITEGVISKILILFTDDSNVLRIVAESPHVPPYLLNDIMQRAFAMELDSKVLDALGKNLHSGAEVLEEITRYNVISPDTAKIMLGNPQISEKVEKRILRRWPELVGVSRKHHLKWKLLGR